MRPIVNGLEEEYGAQVAFRDVNARDGETGERLFGQLSLPGHPAILIYAPDGEQLYRGVGIVAEAALRAALTAALAAP